MEINGNKVCIYFQNKRYMTQTTFIITGANIVNSNAFYFWISMRLFSFTSKLLLIDAFSMSCT